jgi:hypothetical protein
MSDYVEKHVKPIDIHEYLKSNVQPYLADPPDNLFQCGFLAALLMVAKEVGRIRMDMPPYAEADALCTRNHGTLRKKQREIALL